MPRSPDIVCLYITASSKEEATAISRTLLAERLIACANIVEHGTSLYWWQGKICESPEAYILAKTQQPLLDRAMARARELHSYECPCITSWTVEAGLPAYLLWVREQTSPQPNSDQ